MSICASAMRRGGSVVERCLRVRHDGEIRRAGGVSELTGGYHHHIGANTWQSAGAGPRDRTARDCTGSSCVRSGGECGDRSALDPWGTDIRIVPGKPGAGKTDGAFASRSCSGRSRPWPPVLVDRLDRNPSVKSSSADRTAATRMPATNQPPELLCSSTRSPGICDLQTSSLPRNDILRHNAGIGFAVPSGLAEHAPEDRVDMLGVVAEVEFFADLGFRQARRVTSASASSSSRKSAPCFPDLHRVALDEPVGVLAATRRPGSAPAARAANGPGRGTCSRFFSMLSG